MLNRALEVGGFLELKGSDLVFLYVTVARQL